MRELEALPDDQIDTTDAPEILDWSDARRRAFYRPAKRKITDGHQPSPVIGRSCLLPPTLAPRRFSVSDFHKF